MRALVVITGASTGIGRASAEYFLDQGYGVIATARDITMPNFEHPNLSWMSLDLMNPDSIAAFVAEVLKIETPIEALVNNAGYGLMSSIEWASEAQIREQFEVNYFGNMAIIRGILPKFLAQKSGNIVTVTSIGGRIAFPFYGYYNATKHALEASVEALWFETQNTEVRIKIVEPGFIRTDFVSRSQKLGDINVPRLETAFKSLQKMTQSNTAGSTPDVIAKIIFKAAISRSKKLRYAGWYLGRELLALRRFLPEFLFAWLIGSSTLK